MKKPVLIIMAAGMGSRFGGLKQVEPIDEFGHMIIDFSLFDARRAGFETAIFVIRPEIEATFRQAVGDRISKEMEVKYVHQHLTDLPADFSVPPGRTKPWGTAHAVMSARKAVDSPFAVINADDYYGQGALQTIYDFLSAERQNSEHAMVGYKIENTLTEHGYVSRGICQVDEKGYLTGVVERTHIEWAEGRAVFIDDHGKKNLIPAGAVVSMNLWGFGLSMMAELISEFSNFLNNNLSSNPLKGEYFLPYVPNKLISEAKASVKVLSTNEKWYGITYPEDKDAVYAAIKGMKAAKKYPEQLWEVNSC